MNNAANTRGIKSNCSVPGVYLQFFVGETPIEYVSVEQFQLGQFVRRYDLLCKLDLGNVAAVNFVLPKKRKIKIKLRIFHKPPQC